jgi:hypothetical protein
MFRWFKKILVKGLSIPEGYKQFRATNKTLTKYSNKERTEHWHIYQSICKKHFGKHVPEDKIKAIGRSAENILKSRIQYRTILRDQDAIFTNLVHNIKQHTANFKSVADRFDKNGLAEQQNQIRLVQTEIINAEIAFEGIVTRLTKASSRQATYEEVQRQIRRNQKVINNCVKLKDKLLIDNKKNIDTSLYLRMLVKFTEILKKADHKDHSRKIKPQPQLRI